MRVAAAVILLLALCGCESLPKPEGVNPAVVKVTSDSFCKIMEGLFPESNGKPTWDVRDTRATILNTRKIGVAVDSKCKPASPKPAS